MNQEVFVVVVVVAFFLLGCLYTVFKGFLDQGKKEYKNRIFVFCLFYGGLTNV